MNNMTVDIYKGEHVTAESAYSYIDAEAIMKKYNELKNLVRYLSTDAKKIEYSKDFCSPKAFSVNGKSYIEKIEYYEKKFNHNIQEIDEYADELLKGLQKALNEKQKELNELAKKEDKKKSMAIISSSKVS